MEYGDGSMKIQHVEANEALVRLSNDELLILNNALNEVCHGLDLVEFSTRMGAELEDVHELLNQIGKVINTMEQHAKV
jgi:hypothetical protein